MVDIFVFTPYDIQALWLPVKGIVDKRSYSTALVKAQETDLFLHLLIMSYNIISFYA